MPKSRIAEILEHLSAKKPVKYTVYSAAVVVFFVLILLPPILGIFMEWGTMEEVFKHPEYMTSALSAVQNSFVVALAVSALDIIAGIPIAWLVSRSKSKWLTVLDTFVDIPFIVPTAALGFSLFLFWSDPREISSLFTIGPISRGWALVMLLHFTFSYPVVVRVIAGALMDYKREYENASRTLGAPPLMAARTVTFSIIKPSLIAAFILAFSRSLSETGATFIVAGAFENAPVFIKNMKKASEVGLIDKTVFEGTMVFTSFILIAIALAIFMTIRVLGPRLKVPVKRFWPAFERKLSYSKAESTRNIISVLVFLIIVLIPSLFVALPTFKAALTDTLPKSLAGADNWAEYWQSLGLSFMLGAIVTILNILIGLPMAVILARKKLGSLPSAILDLFVNVPLIVPSIALGLSLTIFWRNFGFIPEIWLLIFAHLTITYPYFVRSMSAAMERISPDIEEAAKTLGAKPFAVFKTIILPLTKYSILSGAIMIFTRSLSETGATIAVTTMQTAPVVLVKWVDDKLATTEIGLGCGYLILFSFVILLALRFMVREKGRY